jgi:hypothetical protein
MSTRPDSIIRPPGSSDIDRYAPFKYRYDAATKSVAFSQRGNKKWIELPIDRTYARHWYKVGIAVRSAEFIKKTSGLFSVISQIPYIGQKFDLREKVAHWGVYFEDPETQKVHQHKSPYLPGNTIG